MIPTQNLVPGACDPQQTAFSHLEPWTWSLESRRSHSEIKANRSEYGIWYLSSAMWNLEARNGFTSLGSGFYTMECVALCVSLSLAVVVDITKQ